MNFKILGKDGEKLALLNGFFMHILDEIFRKSNLLKLRWL